MAKSANSLLSEDAARTREFVAAAVSLPDFLIVGAARAGTTALHGYLRQAPGVFMPALKEPNFFAYAGQNLACRGPGADFINNSVTDLARYRGLFAPAPAGTIRGEASPLYLYEPAAPRNIKRIAPDAKMVVILRNPIEQAWSHFLQATKLRVEPLASFADALHAEPERIAAGWQPMLSYARFARFGEQLERYLALFPREQLLIRTYDEWQRAPHEVIRDVFRFIGADPEFVPDMSRRPNSGGVPRNPAVQDFLMKPNPITGLFAAILPVAARRAIRDRLAALNLRRDETMPSEARAILHRRLDPDIARLSELIGQDLSHWR